MCHVFTILEEIDFSDYADGNTPFVSEDTPEYVLNSPGSCSAILYE